MRDVLVVDDDFMVAEIHRRFVDRFSLDALSVRLASLVQTVVGS